MKITLENTTKIVHVSNPHAGRYGSVPARIWVGETDSGIAIHAYVTLIAVDLIADATQFKTELRECRTPTPEIEAIPLRLIL